MTNIWKKVKQYYKKHFGSPFAVIVWLIVFVWCLSYALFLFWGITTSFKISTDFYYNPIGFPKKIYAGKYGTWHFENYVKVWKTMYVQNPDGTNAYVETLLGNSLFYCCAIAILNNLLVMLNTYIAARFKHVWFVPFMWGVYLFACYNPLVPSTASTIKLMRWLGFYDNPIGLILWNIGGYGGAFMIFYGSWKSFSPTYAEAARMDGAGEWTIFFKIMFPLIRPVFFVYVINTIRALWDDYMVPIMYMPHYPTMALAAYQFQIGGSDGVQDVTGKLAGYLMFSIPMVVMYFATKNRLVKSSSLVGGIKG